MSEQSSSAGNSWPDPLSLVWRFFAAPSTLLILTAILAAALIVSQVVPQIPPEAADDPRAWLAGQPGVLGWSNGLLQALGLFDLYHAAWFHLLLALIGLALLVWAVETAEIGWRTGRGRWQAAHLGDVSLWGRQPLQARLSSSLAPGDVQARLDRVLAEGRYRRTEVSGSPAAGLVASRRAAAWWAQAVSFAALILALLGVAALAIWGWEGKDWRPATGEYWVVGHGTPYTVRLDAFAPAAQAGAGAAAARYESRLTWLEADRPLQEVAVSDGRPVTWRGLTLRQVGITPAVTVRGSKQAGGPLLFQSAEEVANPAEEITIAFQSAGAQHLVLLPNEDRFLLFSLSQEGTGARPSVRVDLLGGPEGERQTLGVLQASDTLQVDNLSINVALAVRPVLRVDHRPGMALVVGGLVLAVLALAVGWLAPPRLMWLVVTPGIECPAVVQVLAVGGAAHVLWFSGLVARLREALADGT
jgi:hypothetical protein